MTLGRCYLQTLLPQQPLIAKGEFLEILQYALLKRAVATRVALPPITELSLQPRPPVAYHFLTLCSATPG